MGKARNSLGAEWPLFAVRGGWSVVVTDGMGYVPQLETPPPARCVAVTGVGFFCAQRGVAFTCECESVRPSVGLSSDHSAELKILG